MTTLTPALSCGAAPHPGVLGSCWCGQGRHLVLRLRDCLEKAVSLLLEATAQCGIICYARPWKNTQVCCSGPKLGLVTVATTGLQLVLLLPLNLSMRGPREQDSAS